MLSEIGTYWEESGGDNPLGEFETYQDAFDWRGSGTGKPIEGRRAVVCMDDGISGYLFGQLDLLSTAGSGILFPPAEEALQRNKHLVDFVLSHPVCGAAGLYAAQEGREEPVDEVAMTATQALADRLDVPYLGMLPFLNRPEEFHPARTILVDCTDGYNARDVDTFPQGFHISGLLGPEVVEHDVKIAYDIATGESGFGERFTPDSKLHVVGIFDRSTNQDAALQSLTTIAESKPLLEVHTFQVYDQPRTADITYRRAS